MVSVASANVLPLVCLDVDGTLVGSAGAPSDRLWDAAARARGRGQHLTLCTARLAAGATRDWAARLDPDGLHIFHTGAAIWCPSTGEVQTDALTPEAVAEAVAVGDEHDWVTEVYTWDDFAVDSDAPLAIDHAVLLKLPHRRRPLDAVEGPVVRVQWVVDASEAAAAVAAAPSGCTASAASSPSMPGAAFVSVTNVSVSKASGIATIASRMGVAMDEVMMVGDGHNDVPAMRAVGWPVAIGDGAEVARAAARIVVAGVDDDGAAEAIERSVTLPGDAPTH